MSDMQNEVLESLGISTVEMDEERELEKRLAEQKKKKWAAVDKLFSGVESITKLWGVNPLLGKYNYILSPLGYEVTYVGVVRVEACAEIMRKVNSAPNKVCDLDLAVLDTIAKTPDVNCDVQDVRRSLRYLVAGGNIVAHNPDNKRGRNSTYTVPPTPASADPVKGGKPKA